MFIFNWSHHFILPFTVSEAVTKSVIQVDEGVPFHSREIEVPDQKADDNSVKGATGIKEEEEDWLMKDM